MLMGNRLSNLPDSIEMHILPEHFDAFDWTNYFFYDNDQVTKKEDGGMSTYILVCLKCSVV